MANQKTRRRRTIIFAIVLLPIITLGPFLILTMLVAPKLVSNIMRSKQKVARSQVASVAQQFHLYMLDNGMTRVDPNTPLAILTTGTTPYLNSLDLFDPWGRPYLLHVPGDKGTAFKIISYGADGTIGGEGENADTSN